MPGEDYLFLDEAGAGRVVKAVRRVEAEQGTEPVPRQSGHTGRARPIEFLLVNGAVTSDGRYPAKIQRWDEATKAWLDLADAYLRPLNSGTLDTIRYYATLDGIHNDGKTIWQAFC